MGEKEKRICRECRHYTFDTLTLCIDHMETSVNCSGCMLDGLCICSTCINNNNFVKKVTGIETDKGGNGTAV